MTVNGSTRRREDLLAFVLYLALIALLYAPVVFTGKSMLPGLYQPHGVMAEGVYEHSGRHPLSSFNIDIATPAYYEFPVNKLVGDIYLDGEVPLWNPYQASGTPLAAQYSSRAFFPYQVIEDISPVETWDFFMLGRLLIAGFFTYLFLRALGLAFPASFAGGVFFCFSGVFTWFINLEQLTNTAMMVPVVIYAVELIAGTAPGDSAIKRRIAFAGASFAGLLLAGQPEVALYVSLLAALYFLVRRISLYRWEGFWSSVLKISSSYVLGLMLAAPLLLIFLEFVDLSFNIHPSGSTIGTEAFVNWRRIFAYLTPTATEFASDPSMIVGINKMINLKGEFFRYMPINRVWDTLGGYTGVVPIYLIAAGVLSALTNAKSQSMFERKERAVFIFFVLFAAEEHGCKTFSLAWHLAPFRVDMVPQMGFPGMVIPGRSGGRNRAK